MSVATCCNWLGDSIVSSTVLLLETLDIAAVLLVSEPKRHGRHCIRHWAYLFMAYRGAGEISETTSGGIQASRGTNCCSWQTHEVESGNKATSSCPKSALAATRWIVVNTLYGKGPNCQHRVRLNQPFRLVLHGFAKFFELGFGCASWCCKRLSLDCFKVGTSQE